MAERTDNTERPDEERRMHEFVVELTALTRKHGVSVCGCGCCGSPWLILMLMFRMIVQDTQRKTSFAGLRRVA